MPTKYKHHGAIGSPFPWLNHRKYIHSFLPLLGKQEYCVSNHLLDEQMRAIALSLSKGGFLVDNLQFVF